MVPEVGNPQFFMFAINKDARGIQQTGPVTFDHAPRSNVTLVGSFEHQYGMTDVISDVNIAGIRVDRHLRGPVQLCS